MTIKQNKSTEEVEAKLDTSDVSDIVKWLEDQNEIVDSEGEHWSEVQHDEYRIDLMNRCKDILQDQREAEEVSTEDLEAASEVSDSLERGDFYTRQEEAEKWLRDESKGKTIL